MTIEHTEGDLQFSEIIHEANQFMIYTGPVAKWLMRIQHNGEQLVEKQRANLRRMVACWNACKGITTESLEENGAASYEQSVELAKVIAEQQVMMKDMLQAFRVFQDNPNDPRAHRTALDLFAKIST